MNSIFIKKALLFGFILWFGINDQVRAQIDQGGTPLSFSINLKSQHSFPVEVMPKINVEALLEEDKYINSLDGYPFRFSTNFKVNLSTENSGSWYDVKNGRIWRIGLLSSKAYSVHIIFSKYKLPPGATVFVYNKDNTQILGAFTEKNNKPWESLALTPITGDEIIVEYFEPSDAPFSGILRIGEVGHGYRDIFGISDDRFGLSESCNKDINCSIADDWQVEKHAVCRIIFTKLNGNSYLCTGSLINNTRNDETPYFLTANHCIPTIYEAERAVFYFNYESPTCNGPDGNISQTISGSNIRATTTNLDFSLIEMSETIPLEYEPYFAGWDATPDPAENVTAIHHPLGDVKKISFYDKSPITGDFIYEFDFDDSTHWYIDNWTLGITQGGSSGSPIFNQNHHVVGDLTGGSVVANCTSADAYYAKFSESWDKYSFAKEQLKFWLDPDTTNIQSLNGYSPTGLKFNDVLVASDMFDVFPNPASGNFTIQLLKEGLKIQRIELYSLLGKKVLEQNLKGSLGIVAVNIANLIDGIYLIRVYTDQMTLTSKLRIKH